MFIIKLIRALLGFVTFSASGGFPERFVNLCRKNNIPLWDLQNKQGVIFANTTIKGYKSIRDSAHRSGMHLKIVKRTGFPFFTHSNRRRVGVAAGLCISILLVSVLSSMLWSVRVTGNESIPDEVILQTFSEYGVRVGVPKSRIDVKYAAEQALLSIDGLTWASVNISGSNATIEVRENVSVPKLVDKTTPCNIVADEDGVICTIEVFEGEADTEVGSAVQKGDLLISGVVTNKDLSESLKHAEGNVRARVEKKIRADFSEYAFYSMSSEKTRYSLFLFGLRIPLGRAVGEENYYKSERYLSNGNVSLPIGLVTERAYRFAEPTTFSSEENKILYAAKVYMTRRKALCETAEILTEKISLQKNGENICFSGTYTCEKEIGVKKEIFVEKN